MATVFKSTQQINVGTSPVNVLVTPAGKVNVLIDVSCANILAAQVKGTILLNNTSTDANMIKDGPIPPGGAMVVSGAPRKIAMTAGHTLKAVCDTPAGMDVVVSYLEQDQV